MARKTTITNGRAPTGTNIPADRKPDPPLVAKARRALEGGRALIDKDDLKAAVPLLEEALSLMARPTTRPLDRLEVLVNLSYVFSQTGNLNRGESLALEALELMKGPDVPVLLKGQANYVRGFVLLSKGDFSAALTHIERALSLFQTAGNKEWMAHNCRLMGNAYSLNSQYGKAIVYYKRAIKLYQEVGRDREMWFVRHNMALSLGSQGNYTDAIKEMEVVLVNVARLDDRRLMASCHSNLGIFHLHVGQFDKAFQHFNDGARLARDMGDHWTETYSILGKIEVLLGRGDVDGAQRLMEEHYKSFMASKSTDIMGQTLRVKGIINRTRGGLKKAEDNLALAVRLLAEDPNQVALSEVYIEWGRTAAMATDRKKARQLFGKARAIYKNLKLPLREKNVERVMRECGL
jgi:tetratricopeptide (TPR) repeat protein